MKTFYLIRHGEKETLSGNPPLTALGQKQAQQTAKHLTQFPITHVVASPLLRTQQTAEHIAAELHVLHETHVLLKERANWGDIPQQSFSDFLREWQKTARDRLFVPKNGDSSQKAGQRIEQLISELQQSNHTHIALITHGGVISDFLRNVFPYGEELTIPECSLTIVHKEHGKFSLVELASTKHLLQSE